MQKVVDNLFYEVPFCFYEIISCHPYNEYSILLLIVPLYNDPNLAN